MHRFKWSPPTSKRHPTRPPPRHACALHCIALHCACVCVCVGAPSARLPSRHCVRVGCVVLTDLAVCVCQPDRSVQTVSAPRTCSLEPGTWNPEPGTPEPGTPEPQRTDAFIDGGSP